MDKKFIKLGYAIISGSKFSGSDCIALILIECSFLFVSVESNGSILTQNLVIAVYTFSKSQSRSLSIVALFNGSRGYKLCPVAYRLIRYLDIARLSNAQSNYFNLKFELNSNRSLW